MNRQSAISNHQCRGGSVMLVVVLIAALLAAVVMGHLQISTEEIQLMQNHIHGAEALATAEAGLNDALAQLRQNAKWSSGFAGKPFEGGSYTVLVNGSTITSTAATSAGFTAKIEAEITAAPGGPPYVVRINRLRINE
jgi:Tfp pilus assembly protein PilX